MPRAHCDTSPPTTIVVREPPWARCSAPSRCRGLDQHQRGGHAQLLRHHLREDVMAPCRSRCWPPARAPPLGRQVERGSDWSMTSPSREAAAVPGQREPEPAPQPPPAARRARRARLHAARSRARSAPRLLPADLLHRGLEHSSAPTLSSRPARSGHVAGGRRCGRSSPGRSPAAAMRSMCSRRRTGSGARRSRNAPLGGCGGHRAGLDAHVWTAVRPAAWIAPRDSTTGVSVT